MRKDYRLYLDDILDAIHQIRSYVQGQDEEAFASDRKTQDAVIRNLEIIGEAAGNLLTETKENAREVDWRKIARYATSSFMNISASTCPLCGI